jgi:hypothetical protein
LVIASVLSEPYIVKIIATIKIVATTQLVVQTMVVGFGFFVWACCIYIYIMDIKRKFIIVALVYWGMGAWGHGENLQ